MPLHVGFTWRSVGIQAKTIFGPQEVAELEVVWSLSSLLGVLFRRHRGLWGLHLCHIVGRSRGLLLRAILAEVEATDMCLRSGFHKLIVKWIIQYGASDRRVVARWMQRECSSSDTLASMFALQ
jgi:hypothetical protein